jgi:transcriptional regulator with XRE-family HTH domain
MKRIAEDKPDYPMRILRLRKSLNLNQEELAGRLRVDQAAVSKWENGKNRPEPGIFVKLAALASGPEKGWFLEQAGVARSFFAEGIAQPRAVAFVDLNANTIRSLDTEALCSIMEAALRELKRRNRIQPLPGK